MKRLNSVLTKLVTIGPLPYLGLALILMGVGVVLQLRSGAPAPGDEMTIFGMFARIGGFVGLFGLLPLIFGLPTSRDITRLPPPESINRRRIEHKSSANNTTPLKRTGTPEAG